jgi:hypothetical protein
MFDIIILILLFTPFIIHYITLIIFCYEYLNVINDVLAHHKEKKISIDGINNLGGPGGAWDATSNTKLDISL